MNPRVQSVKPLANYELHLVFTNGEHGLFSCREYLTRGVFKELADERYFVRVKADAGTVTWPHEQDFCPDTLYLESKKLNPEASDARH